MRIIITKEEAINAWKGMNADLMLSEDTEIEIENTSLVGNGTITINPSPLIPRGVGGMEMTTLLYDETNNK